MLIRIFCRLRDSMRDLVKGIKRYWVIYGGWQELLSSPYFVMSMLLAAIMYGTWASAGWWVTVIEVLPSIIGFSLGGYAIFLAFGDESFQTLIAGEEEGKPSPYVVASASFLHFIAMQFLALVYALLASSRPIHSLPIWLKQEITEISMWIYPASNMFAGLLWYFGYFLFIYALATGFAAALNVFRFSYLYDDMKRQEKDEALARAKLKETDNSGGNQR